MIHQSSNPPIGHLGCTVLCVGQNQLPIMENIAFAFQRGVPYA